MAANYPGQCGDKDEKKNISRPRPPFSFLGAASLLLLIVTGKARTNNTRQAKKVLLSQNKAVIQR